MQRYRETPSERTSQDYRPRRVRAVAVTTRHVGLITAYRDEFDPDENASRTSALADDIRPHLGCIRVRGISVENRGTPDERRVTGEHAFMVIGRTGPDSGQVLGFLRRHGEKYGQSCVIYKPYHRRSAGLIGTSRATHDPDYHKEKRIGAFHPNRMAEYYSLLTKGRTPFAYESIEFYSPPRFFRRYEQILTADAVMAIIEEEEYKRQTG